MPRKKLRSLLIIFFASHALVLRRPSPVWLLTAFLAAQPVLPQANAHAAGAVSNPAAMQNSGSASVPQQEDSGYVLQQTVRRVVVDVVVTDGQGHPVRGLQADDFRVFEDGKAQNIREFDVHTPQSYASGLPLRPALPPHTFMNLPATVENGPMTVILYDLLNTPLDAQAYAHQAMLKFLKENLAKRPTAIFVLSDRLHLLQGFTDDQDELLQAIDSKDATRRSSALLQGAGEVNQAGQMAGMVASNPGSGANGGVSGSDGASSGQGSVQNLNPTASSGPPVNMETALAHMETLESSALLDMRVDTTLEALSEIARFLSGVPGRKNLIWLSGSFPVSVAPDPDAAFEGDAAMRNYSEQMKKTSDRLNASQVAVYPVDVRGLQVNPIFDASSAATIGSGSAGARASTKAVQDFSIRQSSEHAAMDLMGEETGGRAFYNTNGLEGALQAAAEDGSNYYSLTYAPTNTRFDGGVRSIKVTVDRSGCHLAYRRSYFADDLNPASDQKPDLASADPEPDSLEAAMQPGMLPAHELLFAAQVDAYGAPTVATPGQMKALQPYLKLAAKVNHRKFIPPHGPIHLQRYVVQYAVLTRQLDLAAGSDGVAHPRLSFAVLAFDKDGNALSGIETRIEDAIPAARIAAAEAEDYRAVQVVFVPVDAVSLRLAVEDANTSRIGTMEVRLPLPPIPQTGSASSGR